MSGSGSWLSSVSSSAGEGVWGLLAIVAAVAPERPVTGMRVSHRSLTVYLVASAVPW